jgi:RNase H-fold protein (predicted Holliday junction resolvase)
LTRRRYIGIDPGRTKCGYAVIDDHGERSALDVIPTEQIPQRIESDLRAGDVAAICIGDATTSKSMIDLCRGRWPSLQIAIVDERNTTLEARRRYYADHPPRGLLRLIPQGLLVPREPLDGYAALLIIERFLASRLTDSRQK